MAYILFISEEKLKSGSAINGNVDEAFLLPYVRVAQKNYVETKLGTDLNDKLKDLIENGTINNAGNAVYKKLLDDYIADMLVHWAFYECFPWLQYKVENKNIFSKTSETGNALSDSEASLLREEIRNTAEYYTERLVDYICNNNSDYPEYSTNTGADVRPDKDVYFAGMNLENTRSQGNRLTLRDFLDSSI